MTTIITTKKEASVSKNAIWQLELFSVCYPIVDTDSFTEDQKNRVIKFVQRAEDDLPCSNDCKEILHSQGNARKSLCYASHKFKEYIERLVRHCIYKDMLSFVFGHDAKKTEDVYVRSNKYAKKITAKLLDDTIYSLGFSTRTEHLLSWYFHKNAHAERPMSVAEFVDAFLSGRLFAEPGFGKKTYIECVNVYKKITNKDNVPSFPKSDTCATFENEGKA